MDDFFAVPKKCEVLGNTLNYYRDGKGETLLFVHGISTYSFIWRKIIPGFISDYDVIAIDLLGCGDSDKPLDKDLSLKQQAVYLNEFVTILEIKKFHIVGHDVGGGIAQIFAVNNTSMLFDLTLINSVAYNFWPVQPISSLRTPIIRQIAMAALDMGMFKLIVKRGLSQKTKLTAELMDLFWKPMKTRQGRKGFLHFAKCLNNKDLTGIEEKLQQLELPSLIIRGEEDVYLSKQITYKLHADLPDSKMVSIKRGGHYIQEDDPRLVSSTILEFIKRKK